MGVPKVCGCCGKDFTVPNRRHETVKFCSRECKTKAGWVQYTCGKCGTLFNRKRSDNADSGTRFCSLSCSGSARKGRTHKVKPDAVRHHKVCEVCGVQFRVTATRKDTARFCSRECQKKSDTFRVECSELQQGEKSWRWAGGEYLNHSGYIRHKKKVLGSEVATLSHRLVVQNAMLELDPNHPFLVDEGGVKKLDSQIEVHHIDRNRSNNALPNLLAVTKHAHAQIHHRNAKPKPWECWPRDPQVW